MENLVGYYYAGCRNSHASLDIYRLVSRSGCVGALANAERRHVETVEVSGKRDAKAILKAMGARPYNF